MSSRVSTGYFLVTSETTPSKSKSSLLQFQWKEWKITIHFLVALTLTLNRTTTTKTMPSWLEILTEYYSKNCHFTSPCNDFKGSSHFADASCNWVKCIWALSPRQLSWVLRIACLDLLQVENVEVKFWTKGVNRWRRLSAMLMILFCLLLTGICPLLQLWT